MLDLRFSAERFASLPQRNQVHYSNTLRFTLVADPKQEETFKVVDRRLFTEDGQLRKDVLEQEHREQEAAKKAASKVNPPGSTARGTSTTSAQMPAAAPGV